MLEAFDHHPPASLHPVPHNGTHRGGDELRQTRAHGQDKKAETHASEHAGPQHAMLEHLRRSARHELGLESLQEGSLLGIREALLARHLPRSSLRSQAAPGSGIRPAAGHRARQAGTGVAEGAGGREEERWQVRGGAVFGFRVPAAPLLSLLTAGGKGAVLYKDCLRAMHFDLCAVVLARRQFEWLFLVLSLSRARDRALSRSLCLARARALARALSLSLYAHVNKHTCIHNINTLSLTHTHTHTYLPTYLSTYIHTTCVNTYARRCMHACIHPILYARALQIHERLQDAALQEHVTKMPCAHDPYCLDHFLLIEIISLILKDS